MATTASPPLSAQATNGISDPFVGSPTYAPRYASLDIDQFSSYSTHSPTQAKRALEAHLRDTDRRIQDASRLGTTLLQQRKDLASRLQEVEDVQQENEVPEDLRKRLADLEKEYNEVGKESARAFLPKPKIASNASDTPSALSGSGRESPTKGVTAPSRRQRNQPSNRVHDIEFATEISTSLLAQVRQLQAALAEKDEELKDTLAARSQLETDNHSMVQRIKHLDDNEQRYKDENWSLETRLQELETSHKEATEREQRATQGLKSAQSEKAAAQRDLDDLRVSHEKLNEEHSVFKRQQETDLHGLRRNLASHETEKSSMQKKIDELTSQNTELAKAVSYRFNQPSTATDTDFASANEEQERSDGTPDESAPESPVKGTPRHGMLESETLKSSLNHAHRMIQNLKNNIHREKTEKIELKRMLQEARDELETRRSDSGVISANVGKKRRSELDNGKFKKPARPLGANRGSTTEIVDDEQDWEDHDGTSTPTRSMNMPGAWGAGAFSAVAGAAALGYAASGEDTETTDAAFETATERGSDAFETGNEDLLGDDSEELTETETNVQRNPTVRKATAGFVGARPYNRQSFQSTASLSDNEDEGAHTPIQVAQQPKYRLRLNRGSKRDRVSDLMRDSPSGQSPASSNGTPQQPGQSLGDELDALDEDSVGGTPGRMTDSAAATPETQRHISVTPGSPTLGRDIQTEIASTASSPKDSASDSVRASNAITFAHEYAANKPVYADAGVMTDPWQPEPSAQESSLKERAAEVVGGALAGFGLGRFTGQSDSESEATAGGSAPTTQTKEKKIEPPTSFEQSAIVSQDTAPVSPPRPQIQKRVTAIPPAPQNAEPRKEDTLAFSQVVVQDVEPVELPKPILPQRELQQRETSYASAETQVDDDEQSEDGISSTGLAAAGVAGAALIGAGLGARKVLGEVSNNTVQQKPANANERDSLGLMPLMMKKAMADEGSQTMVSGDDIEDMLRDKRKMAPVPFMDVNSTPVRPSTAIHARSTSVDGVSDEAAPLKTPRRPASAGSMRNKAAVGSPPPLPEDHTRKIAAAQKVPGAATVGTMGPPLMPASAYKQKRPNTPLETGRTFSRDGTTPRARQVQSPTYTQASRRTSISSFASEVDERFHGRAQFMYPEGVKPATDPRMIQAITQTMIGEYLWKYTRKAGRSDTSNSRHRRFFWVHPYTRTLYWSEKDPSTAGRDMLKAKSVAIDAVRVITDDNAYPPGLHRKSLVVVTPGREIVFTAPTGQRHETWFNALSYLLLRTEAEKTEADDDINQDDIDEFRGGFGSSIRRSISKMTGRSQSRVSLSSYNSRTTRNSSPPRGQRESGTVSRSMPPPSPSPGFNETTASRTSTVRDSNAGRFSSITSRFKPTSAQRGSYGTARGRTSEMSTRGRQGGGEIYDASVAAESAEDLRAVIQKQEQDADRLENVRACCDGKHDVGSLSRTSRHSSLGNRFTGHSHSHAHPRAEPIQES